MLSKLKKRTALMAEENGNYDWQERMRRLEERNLQTLRESLISQKENVDNLLLALRNLIDRIPPENLR
jgi:hypothetical protein